MSDQKNMIIAIVLSLVILLSFQFFYEMPRQRAALEREQALAAQQAEAERQTSTAPSASMDTGDFVLPEGAAGQGRDGAARANNGDLILDQALAVADRNQALDRDARVEIATESLTGSIRLRGARLDDLTLNLYRQSANPDSAPVVLLSPVGTAQPYYSSFGFIGGEGAGAVPGDDTLWDQVSSGPLSVDNPLVLRWDNGAGLIFERRITVDRDYLFTITDMVANDGTAAQVVRPYGLVMRGYRPETSGFFILHEGPISMLGPDLEAMSKEEVDYGDLIDDGPIRRTSHGGWLGITDKYWMVSLVPRPDEAINTTFRYAPSRGQDRFQVDFLGETREIAPNETLVIENRIFAGAKRVDLIDRYETEYQIPKFELAVDWGWFYFLTRPMYWMLHALYGFLGNYGLAIIGVTLVVKIIFFPLANKSYKSMSQLKKLTPDMQRIRERFADDKMQMNQEMMALYKKHKVNPASGCLPILIQIPVFFALYKVLFVTIEMRHAPFFGWIQDLSAPDPTSIFNLFGLIPWEPPQLLMIGVWPLLMGASMFLQQKLNPAPADPIQQKIFMALPIVFTILLASFPAGLVVYWTTNNLLSIAQQYVIMRRMGVPIGGKAEPLNIPGLTPKPDTKSNTKSSAKTDGKLSAKPDGSGDAKGRTGEAARRKANRKG